MFVDPAEPWTRLFRRFSFFADRDEHAVGPGVR